SSLGNSGTGAAKKRGTKVSAETRMSTNTGAVVDALPLALTTTGASVWVPGPAPPGAITVSSVGEALSTSVGRLPNVTTIRQGSGSKPRPRRTTRSPADPEEGESSNTMGRRPRSRSTGFAESEPIWTDTDTGRPWMTGTAGTTRRRASGPASLTS